MTIPFYSFAQLTSTNEKAEELLASAVIPPFAVAAGEQSQGRGQRGRSWVSPPGGLYLTLVLPAAAVARPLEHLALVPLKTAVIIAGWLRKGFGFSVQVKWPNDLLYAGRKLGGILCSTSMQGEQAGPLLIGIGLNLLTSPAETGEYRSVSVQEIAAATQLDPLATANDLSRAFMKAWDTLAWDQVVRHYQQLHLASGQWWYKGQEFYWGEGISPRGELELLTSNALATPYTVSSAGQDFRWAYQHGKQQQLPLLVGDIGNSQAKFALFAASRAQLPRVHWRLPSAISPGPSPMPSPWADIRKRFSEQWRSAAPLPDFLPIYCSEVNPQAFQQLSSAARAEGLCLLRVPKQPLLVKTLAYPLAELGLDRLATMEGWLGGLSAEERRANTFRGLVVTLGTATTCDVLDADGSHRGGLIVPGLNLALASLHQAAHQLPLLHWDPRKAVAPSLGQATQNAMRNGVLLQLRGLLAEIKSLMGDEKTLQVVFTGGLAANIARDGESFLPELTVQGIRNLALGGWLGEC